MGSVNVFTAERMQEIEDTTVVSGLVDVNGDLILYKRDGSTINAGDVIGPPGPTIAATTTVAGVSEYATDAEAIARSLATRTVTPANLATFINQTALPAVSTDANTLIRSGLYTGYLWTNTPVSAIGALEVLRYSDDWIVQRFYVINVNVQSWTRMRYSGTTWSAWKPNATQTDIDTINTALSGKLPGSLIAAKPATDVPSSYPSGTSIMSIGTDATWPANFLTVVTNRYGADRTSQTASRKATGQTWVRSETDGNLWGAWFEAAGPGGARAYGNGMVKIMPSGGSGVTITADGEIQINSVGSWRIDDCFPPEFRFFQIIFQINTASSAGLLARMASGVTVDSSANYDYGGTYNGGGNTALGATADDQPHWIWDGGMSGNFHNGSVQLRDPNFAGATFWSATLMTRRTATPSLTSAGSRGGLHQLGTAYSGLWMGATAGTATGVIDIYGYR